jgi:hypothetical protein
MQRCFENRSVAIVLVGFTLTAFTSRSSLSTFSAEVERLSLERCSDGWKSKQFGIFLSRLPLTEGLRANLEVCELQ